MKIQLPVKVEVCVLDIFTQEQYHVKSFWEKIGPPLIHYLTCDSKQPLTIGAGWGWCDVFLGQLTEGELGHTSSCFLLILGPPVERFDF